MWACGNGWDLPIELKCRCRPIHSSPYCTVEAVATVESFTWPWEKEVSENMGTAIIICTIFTMQPKDTVVHNSLEMHRIWTFSWMLTLDKVWNNCKHIYFHMECRQNTVHSIIVFFSNFFGKNSIVYVVFKLIYSYQSIPIDSKKKNFCLTDKYHCVVRTIIMLIWT